MIIEYDIDGNEVARYPTITIDKLLELESRVGVIQTQKFFDALAKYGVAYLRPEDPNENGCLFKETK